MASHSSTVKDTIDLPKSPHQPKGFSFPKKKIFELLNSCLKKNRLILGPGFIIVKDLTASASEGQLTAHRTKDVLKSIRNEEMFNLFWEKVIMMTQDIEVNDPVMPRKRRVPQRYDDGIAQPEYDQTPKDMYRRIYFEDLDLLI